MNEIWDLQKTQEVQKFHCSLDIDDETLFGEGIDPDMRINEYQKVVAHGLANIAKRVSDAEISIYDVDFSTRIHAQEFTRTLTGHWAPVTTNITLRGGPQDGRFASVKSTDDVYLIRGQAGTYILGGWNSTARHWIYDLQLEEKHDITSG